MRLSLASAVATFCVALVLYPLLNGGGWFWGSLGAVLVVLGAGALSGRLALPAWAATLVSLVATLLYLTAVFTGTKAWALVVPTKESVLALGKLLATGWADIQRFAAPVPANAGVSLLTTAGVALIAITVDLLAARLRRTAVAGLPLLALIAVPATILPDPMSWPAFILAALGFVALLIADGRERISRWGRAVLVRRTRNATGGPRETTDTRGLRLSGKRIGFAAIALAILVPALLPSMEPVSWFTFGVGGSGKGGKGNSISIPDPVVALKGQLTLPEKRTVLTYANNDNQPRYLKIYSLNLFNGDRFELEPPRGAPENRVENGPLPRAPGLGESIPVTAVTTRIRISEEVERLAFLPLPYPPSVVRAEGDWRADVESLMVFSTREDASGMEYEVVSTEPAPKPEQLDASPPVQRTEANERLLRLPEDLPEEIRELADKITAKAETPYQKAVRIQEHFRDSRNGYTYSLQTQGQSADALLDFLIYSKTGYCEQYAAAMAVLARAAGIPARVAIGYTGGTKVDDGFAVATSDMHAWPELYFEGIGWLAFEPTPTANAPLGQGTARVPPYSLPQVQDSGDESAGTATGTPGSGEVPTGGTSRSRNIRELEEDRLAGLGGVPVEESVSPVLGIGIGVLVLLLLLLVPAGVRLVTRSRRVRSLGWKVSGPQDDVTARAARVSVPVAAAWAELDDVLDDYGMARQPSETPRALARRLTEQQEFDAGTAAAISALSQAVERVLFARDPGEVGPLGKELKLVRRALARTVSRRTRLRAALLPPSTMRRLRRLGEGLLDGFDRLETIRLRRSTRTQAPSGSEGTRKELVSK
ncbi:transglutaminase TgpA family protein [Thermoactinospora rubra]|uniref:transglutaminase TgpA family protein n=1 Tax=Thermoactinospora rubra TaxID=1088767 RepID=UPI000A0FFB79|nr:DUF3488 and transglutaminase-like domain-containing protein [Thermoactinospora rubra]